MATSEQLRTESVVQAAVFHSTVPRRRRPSCLVCVHQVIARPPERSRNRRARLPLLRPKRSALTATALFFRFPSLSSLPDSDTSLVAQHTQHVMIPSLSAAAPLFRSSAPVSLVGAAAAAAVVVVLARGRSVRLSRRIRTVGARCQIDEG